MNATTWGTHPIGAASGGTPAPSARPLRMAVPKGSLFKDSVEALRRAGVPVGALANPGRQLLVREGDFEFIIARPTDIPVYIAYGGVDVAIAGKDTLVEAGLDVVEMVDLGFGGCRFVVAEPESAAGKASERMRHLGVIRVATKYPRVTEMHFTAKGVQVEIIKLHGNIELAPLIGMADLIVDITATGSTLRENNLRIVDDVLASTARLVANPVSVRVDAERVRDLAERLRTATADMHGLTCAGAPMPSIDETPAVATDRTIEGSGSAC
jgi:ATP phosphoribosyltransferase regulatory subunit